MTAMAIRGAATIPHAGAGRGSTLRPRTASAAMRLPRSVPSRHKGCFLRRCRLGTGSAAASCPPGLRLLCAETLPALGSRCPWPPRWRLVLVLPASTTCCIRRHRRRPPPARGQSRGRTGGGATYAPSATRDIRVVDRAAAAGEYRDAVRAAAAVPPRAPAGSAGPGGPALSPRHSQQLRGGGVHTHGGSGGGTRSPGERSVGRRARPRDAAAGPLLPAAGAAREFPSLPRSDRECWVCIDGKAAPGTARLPGGLWGLCPHHVRHRGAVA